MAPCFGPTGFQNSRLVSQLEKNHCHWPNFHRQSTSAVHQTHFKSCTGQSQASYTGLLSPMTMQGFLIIMQFRSNISKCQIFLWKRKTWPHRLSVSFLPSITILKPRRQKMSQRKEESSHPLGNCGYQSLDKPLTKYWVCIIFTQGFNITPQLRSPKGMQRWTEHDSQSQRILSLKQKRCIIKEV